MPRIAQAHFISFAQLRTKFKSIRNRLRTRLLCLMNLVVTTVGCGSGGGQAERVPTVGSFSVQPTSIELGASAVLTWDISGADSVKIDQGIGTIRGGNSIQIQPSSVGSTTYTLSASNGAGTTAATATISTQKSATAPFTPTGFSAAALGAGSILVSWSPDSLANSYVLEWSSSTQQAFTHLATVGGRTYWFVHTGTNANDLFTYRLRAANVAGESAAVTASALSAPAPPEGPPQPAITPSPPPVISPGKIIAFSAGEPVSWTLLDGPGSGSIDASGLYTAPAGTGTFHLAVRGRSARILAIQVE